MSAFWWALCVICCLQAHINWSAWILAALTAAWSWKDSSTHLEWQVLGKTSTTRTGKGLESVSSYFPMLSLSPRWNCWAVFMLQLKNAGVGGWGGTSEELGGILKKWQLLAIFQLRHLPVTYQGPLTLWSQQDLAQEGCEVFVGGGEHFRQFATNQKAKPNSYSSLISYTQNRRHWEDSPKLRRSNIAEILCWLCLQQECRCWSGQLC